MTDRLTLDFLYLDLDACRRCQDARRAVEAAVAAARPTLDALGVALDLREIHVASLEQARAENFTASPTIRIDGEDIQKAAPVSACEHCGDLCGCADGVDCRVWDWRGVRSEAPPAGLIVEAVLAAAIGSTSGADAAGDAAALGRADIEKFFAGRPAARDCCADDCCA